MLLKNLLNFRTASRKKSTQKQPSLGVLQDRCPEKLLKFHKKTPVLESPFKVSRNEETPAQVFYFDFYGVLQDRCPEKLLKFHKKTTVLESLFNKVSRNEETPAQVFSCEFCETFKYNFFAEHILWSWSLSFKKFYIVAWRFSIRRSQKGF